MVKSHESISIEIERALKKIIACHEQFALKLIVHPELDHYLNEIDKQFLFQLAKELSAQLTCETSDGIHINDFQFFSTVSNKRLEV